MQPESEVGIMEPAEQSPSTAELSLQTVVSVLSESVVVKAFQIMEH